MDRSRTGIGFGAQPSPYLGLLIPLSAVAAATIAVAGVRSASHIVGPTVLAMVLTIAVHPVRGHLVRRGYPGWLAATSELITAYLVLLGLATAMAVAVGRFATLVSDYQDELDDLTRDVRSGLTGAGVGDEQAETMVDSVDLERFAGYLADLLAGLFGALGSLVLVVTLLFFMVFEAASLPGALLGRFTGDGALGPALTSFANGTRRYLVVTTVFGLIVAAMDTLFLWVIHVPAPLLWGLLAFITNYIPNVGFAIGLIPPAMLALLDSGPAAMIGVIVAYSVINFVLQSIIQPRFVGEAVGLPATITFLSMVFWGWALGPLGALLAVPLTLLAKALLIDSDPQRVLTRQSPPRPPAQAPVHQNEPRPTSEAD